MDLTTRCPHCGTVFQASLSDLQLRKGYIRCVQCAQIFDGYAEVVREGADQAAPDAGAATPPDDAPQWRSSAEPADVIESLDAEAPPAFEMPPHVIRSGRPRDYPGESPRERDFRISVPPWPDDGRAAAQESWNEPHLGAEAPEAGRPDPMGARAPTRVPDPIVIEPHPAYREGGGSAAPLLAPDPARGLGHALMRTLGWMLLVLLVLLAAAQLVYVYRAQVAQFAPSLRPWLEQACGPLKCQVPYARQISRIAITGSALKVDDTVPPAAPASPGATAPDEQHFVLQLTMRNQLDQPQQWPMLVLDLKDASGAVLVRRNLGPADYLGGAAATRPFAARSEALIRVPLTLSGMRINGYQLDLFFP